MHGENYTAKKTQDPPWAGCHDRGYTEEGWDEFFRRFDGFIRRAVGLALRKQRSYYAHPEANDLVQQIYERLIANDFRALRNFRGRTEQTWCAYLSRICRNAVVDGRRTRVHRLPWGFEFFPLTDGEGLAMRFQFVEEPSQERELHRRELRELIKTILQRMGRGKRAERDRRVFILRHYQGYSAAEVAQELQVTVNLVNTVYSRVRKRLVMELSEILKAHKTTQ